MVVVILISAAPSGAAPGSRSIGSAFDPTTSEVAVSRQNRRVVVATAVPVDARPALPLAGASGLGVAVSFTLASVDFVVSRPLRVTDWRATGHPRSLTRAHGARAPPTA